jgi:hypothetical protein
MLWLMFAVSFQPWQPAKTETLGAYLRFEFTSDPNVYTMFKIALTQASNGGLIVRYVISGGGKETRSFTLAEAKVERDKLSAKAPSDSGLPSAFVAHFVRRFPPGNAKGPVVPGLKLGDLFFEKSEAQ